VVKQPIEKRQRSCPWREWQVAGEDHAAAFAAFSDDVEEQLRLIRVRGLRKWRLEPQHPVRMVGVRGFVVFRRFHSSSANPLDA
jgi:hypothetical protein